LIEALTLSGRGTALAYGEIEALIEKKLQHAAQFLVYLDGEHNLPDVVFERFLRTNDIDHAIFVDAQGRSTGRWFSSHPQDSVTALDSTTNNELTTAGFRAEQLADFAAPLQLETRDFVSGYLPDRDGDLHYAVAIPRSLHSPQMSKPQSPGALVLGIHSQTLLTYRKRLGIGRLIQNLGSNKEIVYIALQDEQGIIAATGNIRSLSRIAADAFLLSSQGSEHAQSRITDFEDQRVYEVVKPFTLHGVSFGLLRVGLSMVAVNKAIHRTAQRGLMVGLGFIVVIIILVNFLVGHQNFRLLTDAYARIQTYAGNVLQNMADAVVAVNREGQITVFNRAAEKLFNRSARDAIGKRCNDILQGQPSLLDKTLASGTAIEETETQHRVNGKTYTVAVTTTVIRNQAGEIDSAVAVLKDLTERKAMAESLRRQEKLSAMGELASGVAHEIRNPLNSISMIAQRFAREFSPAEKRDEFKKLARAIVTETSRVSDIINRFLEFARPPKLNLARADLNEAVERALALVISEANQNGIALSSKLDQRLPALLLDRNQMEQVFLNLLQNSMQAIGEGGEIVVRTFQTGQEVVAEVSDNGRGIPQEHLGKIFDLYFTTKATGTGMGLSIVHRIVTEHGGRVEVESEAGKGTTICLRFPSQT